MDKSVAAEVAERVKVLRGRMRWTQEVLAQRSGISRDALAKVETGANQLSTLKMRESLARGFGLSTEAFNEYLDGRRDLIRTEELCLAAAAKDVRISLEPSPRPEGSVPRRAEGGGNRSTAGADPAQAERLSQIENALGLAFDRSVHRMSDGNAVLELARKVPWPSPHETVSPPRRKVPDLEFDAARWLDLVAWLRVHGLESSVPNALYVAATRTKEEVRTDLLQLLASDHNPEQL